MADISYMTSVNVEIKLNHFNRSDQQNTSLLLRQGDKVGWYNDGLVKWAGIFSQLEYSKGSLSYFFNISGSNTAYKRVDYFKKKDLILDEKTYKQALGTSMVTEYYFEGLLLIS